MSKRNPFLLFSIALLAFAMAFQSCGTINKAEKGTLLGSAAGGAIGAIIGKKAGNPAIGATIGAALGGTTGAFIGNKLSRGGNIDSKNPKPLYVINGTPYKIREAQIQLSNVKPEQIESVKVLNNNDAVAQFGANGENGAILILLKNAKKI